MFAAKISHSSQNMETRNAHQWMNSWTKCVTRIHAQRKDTLDVSQHRGTTKASKNVT